MQQTTLTMICAGLALTLGSTACKKNEKPKDEAKGGDTAGKSGDGKGTGTSSATGDGVGGSTTSTSSAGGAGLTGLKAETACPKSLGGVDEGLSRTITKACGVVQVTESYYVERGELVLEAGAQLAVAPGAEIRIGYHHPARLVVKGTKDSPVSIRSSGDQAAGAWQGIRLATNAARSSIVGLTIEHAGTDDSGAIDIHAVDVTVKDSIIRDAKGIGVLVGNDLTVAEISGNTFERAGQLALSVPPAAVGAIGVNTFTDGFVQVRGGSIEKSATWRHPGSHFVIAEPVYIDGKNGRATVTVEAGVELRMGPGSLMRVGYHSGGGLILAGTKDKPVVMKPSERAEPGAWLGIQVHSTGEVSVTSAVLEHGGSDELGVLAAEGTGTLTVKDTVLRGNVVGITSRNDVKLKSIDGCTFEGNQLAMELAPDHVSALGANNSYAAGQTIKITGGLVSRDATWLPQLGAEVIATDLIDIEKATLTLAAGFELRVDNAAIRVGYHNKANLRIQGTADKPVVVRGARDEAESWRGIELHSNADGSSAEHLIIKDAGNDASITVADNARLTAKHVLAVRSKGGISHACGAKVTTDAIEVEGGGTATIAATGC